MGDTYPLAALAGRPKHGQTIEGARVDTLGASGAVLRWDDVPENFVLLATPALPKDVAVGDQGTLTYWHRGGERGAWRFDPWPKAVVPSPLGFSDVVILGDRSLAFAPGTTFAEWSGVMATLEAVEDRLPFWQGDALNFGEHHWGDKYTQAVQATGLAYDTLASRAWVCANVPAAIRQPSLSFEHHKAVAKKAVALAEKDRYLTDAAAGKYRSAAHMRDCINRDLAERDGVPLPEMMGCPICGRNEWAVEALHVPTCGHCGAHADELPAFAHELAEALDEALAENARLRAALAVAQAQLGQAGQPYPLLTPGAENGEL